MILINLKNLKKSDEISVYDVLADTKIFKDQKKGDIASENILNKIFPGKSEEEILKEILSKVNVKFQQFI